MLDSVKYKTEQNHSRVDASHMHLKAFDNTKPFEILTLSKNLENSSDTDTAKCDNWTLNEKLARNLIANLVSVSGTERHHQYSVLVCAYEGNLKQGNSLYKYRINAGSWLVVYQRGVQQYCADREGKFASYFLDFRCRPEDQL